MKGYPVRTILLEMQGAEADRRLRTVIIRAARRDNIIKHAWNEACRSVREQEEEMYQDYLARQDRSLLDDALDKELGLGCTRSLYSWEREYNPQNDLIECGITPKLTEYDDDVPF